MAAEETKADRRSALEKALSVFADVKAGEGVTALLLTFGLFLLLSSYYVIKPIRDSLITGVPNGSQYKSWMGAAIAVALLGAVPAYSSFASRVPRNKLLLWVTVFFCSNLVGFYLLGILPAVSTGTGQLIYVLGFFLWVGIFNMMVIAQYWAFANDVYNEEQGKRLFPMIGIGASVGSAVGSLLLEAGIKSVRDAAKKSGKSGTAAIVPLLILAAVVLAASCAMALWVHYRDVKEDAARKAAEKAPEPASEKKEAPPAESRDGAFKLVISNRYLLLIALFSLVFTLVNTNSEFVKDVLITYDAQEQGGVNDDRVKTALCAGVEGECSATFTSEPHANKPWVTHYSATRTTPAGDEKFEITASPPRKDAPFFSADELAKLKEEKANVIQDGTFLIYVQGSDPDKTKKVFNSLTANVDEHRTSAINRFYFLVNVLGAILQSFVVSRIVKFLGLKRAFFILPVIAAVDATVIALLPVWGTVRFFKIAENASDYSLNNTLRNMLWLPTTKRMKYLAKQAVDTFFVRSGDVGSALFVLVFANQLGLGVQVFAAINGGLLVVWFILARLIVVENEKVSAHSPEHAPSGSAAKAA